MVYIKAYSDTLVVRGWRILIFLDKKAFPTQKGEESLNVYPQIMGSYISFSYPKVP